MCLLHNNQPTNQPTNGRTLKLKTGRNEESTSLSFWTHNPLFDDSAHHDAFCPPKNGHKPKHCLVPIAHCSDSLNQVQVLKNNSTEQRNATKNYFSLIASCHWRPKCKMKNALILSRDSAVSQWLRCRRRLEWWKARLSCFCSSFVHQSSKNIAFAFIGSGSKRKDGIFRRHSPFSVSFLLATVGKNER
jgi:hypothetical protein